MRIGFETSVLGGFRTGVGTYTRNLVMHLAACAPEVRFRGFGGLTWTDFDIGHADQIAEPAKGAHETGRLAGKLAANARARLRRDDTVRRLWRAGRGLAFAGSYRRQPIDIFHAFAALPPARIRSGYGAPGILLIHDVSHIRTPQHHPGERLRWLDRLPGEICAAARINTVSRFSRAEIADVYGVDADRIVVTHPGVDSVYSPQDMPGCMATFRALDLEPKRYFLCVGSIESRKNLGSALAAYARLPQRDREAAPLLVVGPPGPVGHDLPAGARQMLEAGQIRMLGYVDRRRLAQLYSHAALFLFPSFYEGFGMPLAEAMACGAPVACSDIGAFREVAGPLARFVQPADVDLWTTLMRQALDCSLQDDPVRKERIARGKSFSWDNTARQTLAMYEDVLS